MSDVKVPYWLQRANFEATNDQSVTLEEAKRLFRDHDWEADLAEQRRLEAAGSESCPPGIGFAPGDGRILHLCPLPGDVVLIHYHFVRARRLLGFIPIRSQAIASNDHLASSRVAEAIGYFFGNQHAELVSLCAAAGQARASRCTT